MTIRILVVGIGHIGLQHALAYHKLAGFEIAGIVTRSIKGPHELPEELRNYPQFDSYERALRETRPDAVAISTWPNTHAEYATMALEAGCHVFMEKPLATNLDDAIRLVELAKARGRKLMLGYILRVHPSWMKIIEIGKTLGKPLVMRFNLNQQSSGSEWDWHKNIIDSVLPMVDCGVHYVDVMCQITGARPVLVNGIAAALWDAPANPNYSHLQVTFDDGSVGWYEAGWGPMMSETAHFVKDVIGPKGSVSIVAPSVAGEGEEGRKSETANIDTHTQTHTLRVHHAEVGPDKRFTRQDDIIDMHDEPTHLELCEREQIAFLKAITEDLDISEGLDAALESLRIVLAADESVRLGHTVRL